LQREVTDFNLNQVDPNNPRALAILVVVRAGNNPKKEIKNL